MEDNEKIATVVVLILIVGGLFWIFQDDSGYSQTSPVSQSPEMSQEDAIDIVKQELLPFYLKYCVDNDRFMDEPECDEYGRLLTQVYYVEYCEGSVQLLSSEDCLTLARNAYIYE